MFSLFKKQDRPEITDFVYMSGLGKYKGIYARVGKGQTAVAVYYFKDTLAEFKKVLIAAGISFEETAPNFIEPGMLFVAGSEQLEQSQADLSGSEVIFLEHFPAFNREHQLLKHLYEILKIKQVAFYVSADEPIFELFGGERLINLMKKLGLGEEEAVSHAMLSQSIERAQKKLEEGLHREIQADSAETWIRLNTTS